VAEIDPSDITRASVTILAGDADDSFDFVKFDFPIRIQDTSHHMYKLTDVAYPSLEEGYLPRILQRSFGVVSFHPDNLQPFLVTWRQVEDEMWYNIWTLRDIWIRIWPSKPIEGEDVLDEKSTNQAAKEVVDHVRRLSLDNSLDNYQLRPLSTTNTEPAEIGIGAIPPLKIRVAFVKVTFIGRTIFQMNVHAELSSKDSSISPVEANEVANPIRHSTTTI
jgi:hypothetical protein